MKKTGIMTDSHSGILENEASKLGIAVLPMPFYIDEKLYREGVDISREEFYEMLRKGADVATSQPSPESVMYMWSATLQEYEELVYIPISSGLSGSCMTAQAMAQEEPYAGRVFVVDNGRVSTPMHRSVLDAVELAEKGYRAQTIKDILEKNRQHMVIYVGLSTLTYLKKGGRITPAAAALGTLLKLKPVLQIQGEKLDAFAKARTVKQAKTIMIDAMKNDFEKRFHNPDGDKMNLELSYTFDTAAAEAFKEEVQAAFPNNEIVMQPLSLSIACHIGPGALAIACSKKIEL